MSGSNEMEETSAAVRLSDANFPVTDGHTASSAAPAGDQAPEPAHRELDVSAQVQPASAAQYNSASGHSTEDQELAASPTTEQPFHSNPAACRIASELPVEPSVSTFLAHGKLQSCSGSAVLQLDGPASHASENTVREVADSAEPALPMDTDAAQADLGREGPPVNGHVPPEAEPMDSKPAPTAIQPADLGREGPPVNGHVLPESEPMDSEPAPIAVQPADMLHRDSAIVAPFSQALDCLEVGDMAKRGVRELAALQSTSSLSDSQTRKQSALESHGNGPMSPSTSWMKDCEGEVNRSDAASGRAIPNGSLANGHAVDVDELELKFSPASKKRRTTVGRPQTSKGPGQFVANLIADGRVWEEDPRTLDQLVEALKEHFSPGGTPPAERLTAAQILRSGVLNGHPVHHKALSGGGLELTGHLMEGGKIACDCLECEGAPVSLSEFEEHSGSWERHLSESVYLTNHSTSLKDMCASVNIACGQKVSRGGALQKPRQQACQCQVCQASSTSLLKCGGGCRMRAHPSCVGLDNQYAGPWSCLSCMEARAKRELEKAEEARAARWAQRAHEAAQPKSADAMRVSSRLQDTPRPVSMNKRAGRGSGPIPPRSSNKPQRVRMAAPTAKVGLLKGRMVRNSNKHKRLFDPDEPNGVKNGEKVVYQTSQGEKLLDGEVRVSRQGPCGILCGCCSQVISCSQFEAHAGRGSRRAPYDNIFTMAGMSLRRLAAALPSEVAIYHAEAEQEQDAVQEDMLGGCVLCKEKNFQREGFSDLTVILCDQCEREFHIGCLRKHKDIDLDGLPEGDWFCSGKCKEIHAALRARVAEGSFNIDADYQWQLLHGKDGSHATTWALKACYEILQESFDPIIDQVSGQDLVRGMVHSMQQGEWDHTGMFTAVLRHKKQPVCALVMRAFGNMLAEVPLIATRLDARRKGHARFLMNALSDLLAEIGVRTLSLPAAHATVDTWTQGFGFQAMAADQLLETRESLRLLVFPGTEVLYKVLLPGEEPYPAPKPDSSPPAVAAVAAAEGAGEEAATAGEPGTAGAAAQPPGLDAQQSGEQAEPTVGERQQKQQQDGTGAASEQGGLVNHSILQESQGPPAVTAHEAEVAPQHPEEHRAGQVSHVVASTADPGGNAREDIVELAAADSSVQTREGVDASAVQEATIVHLPETFPVEAVQHQNVTGLLS